MYIVVNNSISEKSKVILNFNKSMTFTIIHRDTRQIYGGNHLDLEFTPGDSYIVIEEYVDSEKLQFQ